MDHEEEYTVSNMTETNFIVPMKFDDSGFFILYSNNSDDEKVAVMRDIAY